MSMNYEDLSTQYFGHRLSRDVRSMKMFSVYGDNSNYFQKCYEVLLSVEYQCIQDLIRDLRAQFVPGAFAEFGIFQGAWINRLYEMTEAENLSDRLIYGFDSFKGLSAPSPTHDISFWKEGMYAASVEEVRANVHALSRPRIKLVEGFFSESLKSIEATSLGDIAFARIDCDIYEPAKQCLEYLSNRLVHGSLLVFDDWTHDYEVGEGRAFAEWISTVPHLEFKFLFLGPWDHLHLRVLHRGRPDTFLTV